MMKNETIILNSRQVKQRIERIAYQVYEDNFEEKEIIFAGIARSGFVFAKMLQDSFSRLTPIKSILIEVILDKENPVQHTIKPSLSIADMDGKVVIVVDDVLNSGKTLIYSLKPFLEADLKKLRTVLLVDRDHKRYPVEADFVGITISTTLQEHITVDLREGKETVMLK